MNSGLHKLLALVMVLSFSAITEGAMKRESELQVAENAQLEQRELENKRPSSVEIEEIVDENPNKRRRTENRSEEVEAKGVADESLPSLQSALIPSSSLGQGLVPFNGQLPMNNFLSSLITRAPIHTAQGDQFFDLIACSLKTPNPNFPLQLVATIAASGNFQNSNGETLLHIFAKTNNVKEMQHLVELAKTQNHNMPINVFDNKQFTPLARAVLASHLEATDFLLDNKANVALFFDYDNKTSLLHQATNLGHDHRIITALIKKGAANVNARDKDGKTALIYAVLKQNTLATETLLRDCKDSKVGIVDAQDDQKKTALHYAATLGAWEIVKLLVENKASINIIDAIGKTPLFYAITSKNSATRIEITIFLLKSGAEVMQDAIPVADQVWVTPLIEQNEAEKAELARKAELERQAAEAQRVEQERVDAERLAREKAEAERIQREKEAEAAQEALRRKSICERGCIIS